MRPVPPRERPHDRLAPLRDSICRKKKVPVRLRPCNFSVTMLLSLAPEQDSYSYYG